MKQLLLLILLLSSTIVRAQFETGQKYELTRTSENDYEVTIEGELGEGEVWVYAAISSADLIYSGYDIDFLYRNMKSRIGDSIGTAFEDPKFSNAIEYGDTTTRNSFTFQKVNLAFFVVGKAMTNIHYSLYTLGGTIDIPSVGNKTGDTMGIGALTMDKGVTRKEVENGRIVIVRNGVRYNVLGQPLWR